jgi:uncharacterized protein YjiS (DUF1127 family)
MASLAHSTLTVFHAGDRARRVPSLLARTVEAVRLWRRRVRERRSLAGLSEYELRDFGATPVDRFQELSKPFWRG